MNITLHTQRCAVKFLRERMLRANGKSLYWKAILYVLLREINKYVTLSVKLDAKYTYNRP